MAAAEWAAGKTEIVSVLQPTTVYALAAPSTPDTVKADLLAKSITISGIVTGNVKALERIDLRDTGSISGDVTAPRFLMADGARVIGKVQAG